MALLLLLGAPIDLQKYITQKTHPRITHDNQPSSGQLQTAIAHSSGRAAAVAPTAAPGKQSRAATSPLLVYGEVGVVRGIERCQLTKNC